MVIIGVRKLQMLDTISEFLHRLRVLFLGNPYKEPIKPLLELNGWKPADKIGLNYYDSIPEEHKRVKAGPEVLASLHRYGYDRLGCFGDRYSLWK